MSRIKNWLWAMFHPRAMTIMLDAKQLELSAIQGMLNRVLQDNKVLYEDNLSLREEVFRLRRSLQCSLPQGTKLIRVAACQHVGEKELTVLGYERAKQSASKSTCAALVRTLEQYVDVTVRDSRVSEPRGVVVEASLWVAARQP